LNPVVAFKGFIVMEISNRLKSAKMWLGLFWLGGALLTSACAHHDDSADDSSQQQHRHHGGGGGGGRYGHGQGGMFDQSNPSNSPSPAPGE
jgi:Spy/CpxP family protein refolding chaperone